MISGIQSALSGARAFQRQVDVTANNVANVNSREFKKSRVTMEEGQAAGVKAVATRVETPGPLMASGAGPPVEGSNVDLAEELTGLLIGQRGFAFNLKMIEAEDELMGTLLDTVG